jgi:serine/threonine protein kinase
MNLNLHQYLTFKKKLNQKNIVSILKKVGEGIQYMHSKFIVHNDLKLENIMIDPNTLSVKIIDFGLSQVCSSLEDAHSIKKICGTPIYMSPEKVINSLRFSGICADIWSYGIIMYRSVIGEYPFNNSKIKKIFKSIVEDPVQFSSSISDLKFKGMILFVLKKQPEERLTISEILEHEWFDQLDSRHKN